MFQWCFLPSTRAEELASRGRPSAGSAARKPVVTNRGGNPPEISAYSSGGQRASNSNSSQGITTTWAGAAGLGPRSAGHADRVLRELVVPVVVAERTGEGRHAHRGHGDTAADARPGQDRAEQRLARAAGVRTADHPQVGRHAGARFG